MMERGLMNPLGRPAVAAAGILWLMAWAVAGCSPRVHLFSGESEPTSAGVSESPSPGQLSERDSSATGSKPLPVAPTTTRLRRRPGQVAQANKTVATIESPASASKTARTRAESSGVIEPKEPGALEIPRAAASGREEDNVEQFLANFFQRYLAAETYQDSGMLEERRGDSVAKASFMTRYKRQTGEFMLKHIALDRRYLIVRNAAGVTQVDDSAAEGAEERDDLVSTLKVTKRLTKSVSLLLPSLLFPEELGDATPFWNNLGRVERLEPEELREQRCHRLRANTSGRGDAHLDLWIDDDYVLHRLRFTESEIGRVTTWNFYPKFDIRFGPTAFALSSKKSPRP